MYGKIGGHLSRFATPHLIKFKIQRAKIPDRRAAHGTGFELIVSLTSYPARFATLALTLKSLLCQTISPDRIILWIASEDFDKLPSGVRELEKFGLEIRTTDDIRSYKKIIPALQAFPRSVIVTADDDVYYYPDWLCDLITAWDRSSSMIVCHRAHRVRSKNGSFARYREWEFESKVSGVSAHFFPTGVGGVLYPPDSLHEKVLDESDFLTLCPTADDVWLFWMARLAGSTTYNIGRKVRPVEWPGSQRTNLNSINTLQDLNDEQIANMVRQFGYPIVGAE